jgi:hypothetical protein
VSANDPTLAALQRTLSEALRNRDAQAESVARVNIACAYLQMDMPQARTAFEEALLAVRRAQNPRSEGILSMMFAPYFVENGDSVRALELAQRGAEIAGRGRIGHRVLSQIQLARVLYAGYRDLGRAGQAVDRAVALLAESDITNETDRQVVLQTAAEASRAALDAGDVERALALIEIVDPKMASSIRRQAQQPSVVLKPTDSEDLKRLYGVWSSRFASPRGTDPRVADMDGKVTDLLHWDKCNLRSGSGHG